MCSGTETSPALDASRTLPAGFSAAIAFRTDRSIVTVRGELDVLTAAAFGGFLAVAAARRGRLVVVDLSELAFIDASGLGELARVLPRLQGDGGTLTVVSRSPLVHKLLDLTGLLPTVRVEQPAPGEAYGRSPDAGPLDVAHAPACSEQSQ